MNTPLTMRRIAKASPRFKSRITGLFYLITILTGGVVLFVQGRLGFGFDLIVAACYIAAMVLFHELSR